MTYASTILATSGLVSYWRLGDASSPAVDSKGSNNASGVNSPTFGATGILPSGDTDKAVDLESSSTQYLTVADAASLDLGDIFSVEFWFKPESLGPGDQHVVAKGALAYDVYINSSGALGLVQPGVANIVAATSNMSTGSVYHCVCTKTGSTVKLYLNAVDVTGTVSNQTFSDNALALFIGVFNLAGAAFAGTYLDGVLDEVAIYNVAISAVTVSDHYAVGIAAGATLTPGALSLSLSFFTPALSTVITPALLSLSLSFFTPTISTPKSITPAVLSLALAFFTPIVFSSTPQFMPANAGVIPTPQLQGGVEIGSTLLGNTISPTSLHDTPQSTPALIGSAIFKRGIP